MYTNETLKKDLIKEYESLGLPEPIPSRKTDIIKALNNFLEYQTSIETVVHEIIEEVFEPSETVPTVVEEPVKENLVGKATKRFTVTFARRKYCFEKGDTVVVDPQDEREFRCRNLVKFD